MPDSTPLDLAIVAVQETAGSTLYGMVDVLSVTGNVWQTLTRAATTPPPFRVRVVGNGRERFCCGNGIPVEPSPRFTRSIAPALSSCRNSGLARTSI